MTYTCPKCKEPLIRVPRKKRDRVVSGVLPVGRFQCVRHTCRWRGLRVVTRQELQRGQTRTSSFPNTKFRKDSVQN